VPSIAGFVAAPEILLKQAHAVIEPGWNHGRNSDTIRLKFLSGQFENRGGKSVPSLRIDQDINFGWRSIPTPLRWRCWKAQVVVDFVFILTKNLGKPRRRVVSPCLRLSFPRMIWSLLPCCDDEIRFYLDKRATVVINRQYMVSILSPRWSHSLYRESKTTYNS